MNVPMETPLRSGRRPGPRRARSTRLRARTPPVPGPWHIRRI
jgi:hypothetical protein